VSAMTTAIELIETGVSGQGRFRFEPSGVETSLAEVWAQSERVARYLAARVGTGGRVGAFLSNTPACPAVVFGVWRSGNALVSLPYPGRGADLVRYLAQVERMTTLSDVDLILVDDAYREFLPPLSTDVVTFQEAAERGGPPAATDLSGGLIQFTSGSLGRPKGVLLTGEALAANMLAIMDGAGALADGPNAMSWLPLSHDMGFVGMFLTCTAAMGPSYNARRLVLQTPESFLADPSSWLRHCSSNRAALTTAPNFAFELSVRAAPLLRTIDLSAMRICITGAEKVQAGTLRKFTETFEPMGLHPEAICPAYGMAEAALAVTMVRAADPWSLISVDRKALGAGQVQLVDPSSRPAPPVSAQDLTDELADELDEGLDEEHDDETAVVSYISNGAPVDGMQVRIAAPEGQDVGEVQIRGASLFSDYLGADRVLTADGWYPTRDLGFVVGGELYLVGRADETIIVGGQNHYAADIEQTVQHDLVRSGCLAAVPLETGFALLAEPAHDLTPDRLARVCRELARICVRQAGVRPSMVGFLPRGRLPKTPSGKLQRLTLAAALTADQLETICAVWLEGSNR
jgi:acyl-CoA synthetase (AMP-forming)/AMP-acid ligase II